jgi:hypothetical protein
MKNAVLVFADEAIWGGNRKDVGKLKAAITEPTVMIEHKGKDTVSLNNYRRFIFSSNETWPVHLDPDDRRFFVLKVNQSKIGDYSSFQAIDEELNNGGLEALLYELLNYELLNEDISKYNPRMILNRSSKIWILFAS